MSAGYEKASFLKHNLDKPVQDILKVNRILQNRTLHFI